MMRVPWKVILATIVLFSQQLYAENFTKHDFYLASSLGYYTFDSKRELNENLYTAVAGGFQYDRTWGFELVYAKIRTDHEYTRELPNYDFVHNHFNGFYYYELANKQIQPYVILGMGSSELKDQHSQADETQANVGAGIKYHITTNWKLRSDVRAFYGLDDGLVDAAFAITLAYQFGTGSHGQQDADGDNVRAFRDYCPGTLRDYPVDTLGCALDDDKDSVLNPDDDCPNTPLGLKVDSRGCANDSDGDGISDYADECLNTWKGADIDKRGCSRDRDRDGVINSRDVCPGTKLGAKVDALGCYAVLTETVSVRLNVQFDANSSYSRPEHRPEVEKVALFMNEYPLTKVTIEGHSDGLGPDEYNKTLSQRRAETIAQMLVKEFGIDPFRVEAKGYGEDRPIETNDTVEGRQTNRRVMAVVEALLVKQVK